MRKDGLVYPFETQFLEEFGLVGQSKYSFRTQRPRLVKAGLHQFHTDAFESDLLPDSQGTDFSQVLPADMQGTGPYQLLTTNKDEEITEMVIDLAQRPGKDISATGIEFDQALYLFYIFKGCLANHLIAPEIPLDPPEAVKLSGDRAGEYFQKCRMRAL